MKSAKSGATDYTDFTDGLLAVGRDHLKLSDADAFDSALPNKNTLGQHAMTFVGFGLEGT